MSTIENQVSAKQIEANRANAQLSTGPRTEEGKLASSVNAITTGLTATRIFVAPEDEAAFHAMKSNLTAELVPYGELQLSLFATIVHATWNAQRCITIETSLQKEARARGFEDAMLDDEIARKLDRVYRYKRMHESTQRKSIAELRKLQNEDFYRNHATAAALVEEAPSVLVDTRAAKAAVKNRQKAVAHSFDDEIKALNLMVRSIPKLQPEAA
jgi:uncharacterized protein YihD (DUF1040 family)